MKKKKKKDFGVCLITIGPPINSPPGPNISEKWSGGGGGGGPMFSEKIGPPLKNLVPPPFFFAAEIKGYHQVQFSQPKLYHPVQFGCEKCTALASVLGSEKGPLVI